MSTTRVKRKLAAILSADVKGYSRLMGQDEVATVATLKESRDVITGQIQQYNGRVASCLACGLSVKFIKDVIAHLPVL